MSVTDDDLDFDLNDLEPQEGETETDLIKRLRGTIKGQRGELKELRPLKTQVAEQALNTAFSTAFDADEMPNLTADARKDVLALAGENRSPESLRQAAVKLGLVEARPDPHEEELKGLERIGNASAGAGRKAGAVIDRTVVASWSHEKKRRFALTHPDAWESLKRGEPVSGITF